MCISHNVLLRLLTLDDDFLEMGLGHFVDELIIRFNDLGVFYRKLN